MSGPQRKLMGPPEIVMAIKAFFFFFKEVEASVVWYTFKKFRCSYFHGHTCTTSVPIVFYLCDGCIFLEHKLVVNMDKIRMNISRLHHFLLSDKQDKIYVSVKRSLSKTFCQWFQNTDRSLKYI